MSHQEVGNYILLKTLGIGSAGKVKLVQHKTTKQFFAMKILKKHSFDNKADLQKKIQREITLMQLLDHPHILKLNEVCESPKHFYIVLEYASNGELLDFLINKGSLDEITAIYFFRQIIYGVDYLHSHSICHRDLKLENILLDKSNNIKIGDFGLARWMKENIAETSCGSPHYAAPEVLKGLRYDGRIADIWSCGVILYSLLTGNLPFGDTSIRILVGKIKSGKFRMPDSSDPIKDLISKMLVVEPSKRITIEEIKHHAAFTLNFPSKYIVPSPLPLPDPSKPIDINSIDPGIIGILHKIGFKDEEELKNALESDHITIEKAYTRILIQNLSINFFSWPFEEADYNDENKKHFSGDIDGFDLLKYPDGFEQSNNFTLAGLKQERMLDDSSESFYSLAETVPWAPDVKDEIKDIEILTSTLTGFNYSLEVVFTAIQMSLKDNDFEFYYPNEYLIICRKKSISIFATIKGFIGDDEYLGLEIELINGNQEKLSFFTGLISKSMNNLSNI